MAVLDLRDRFQLVYGIGEVNYYQLNRAVRGGFGDPVFGVRYSHRFTE